MNGDLKEKKDYLDEANIIYRMYKKLSSDPKNTIDKIHVAIIPHAPNLSKKFPFVIKHMLQSEYFEPVAFEKFYKFMSVKDIIKQYAEKLTDSLMQKTVDDALAEVKELAIKDNPELAADIKALTNVTEKTFPPNFKDILQRKKQLLETDCLLRSMAHHDAIYAFYADEIHFKKDYPRKVKQQIIEETENRLYEEYKTTNMASEHKLNECKELIKLSKEAAKFETLLNVRKMMSSISSDDTSRDFTFGTDHSTMAEI